MIKDIRLDPNSPLTLSTLLFVELVWSLVIKFYNKNQVLMLVSKQVQEDEWLENDSEQVFVIEGPGIKRLVTDEKVLFL